MKKANIKDADIVEIEDTKKLDVKKLILIVLIGIVSLVGVFFLSTKIRWNAELEDKKFEVLYYNQEEINVEELKGFYDEKIDLKLKDTEAILMYCDSEYGEICVTGDFNNGFENLLRNPGIAINIVILIDLVLLFILIKDNNLGKVKTYVLFSVILLVGLFNIGKVIYEFANYYTFVNDSKNVVDATIIRGLVTENEKEYYPVITYSTNQGDFTTYVDVPLNGKVTDDLPDKNKLTIYYDKVDNSICTSKQSLTKYILPLVVGIMYVVMSVVYLVKIKKNMKI